MESRTMRHNMGEDIWILPYARSNRGLQNKNEVTKDYFSEMKPMLMTLKILGRLPRNFNNKGLAKFKWNTPLAIYSFVIYCIQSYFSIDFIITIYEIKKTSGESSFWVNMADEYYFAMKKCWRPHYSAIAWVFSLMNLPIILMIITVNKMVIFDFPLYHYLLLMPMSLAAFASFLIWILTCWEIRLLSMEISSRITQHRVTGREAADLRKLWTKLVKLATELGDKLSGSNLFFSITNFICFVVGLFGIIAEIYQTQNRNSGFIGVSMADLLSFLMWFAFCEQIRKAADSVGNSFSEKLLKVDFSKRDPAYIKEVKLILRHIEINNPVIEMKGFFKCDRNYILTFMTSAFTYVILLLQSVSMTKTPTKNN